MTTQLLTYATPFYPGIIVSEPGKSVLLPRVILTAAEDADVNTIVDYFRDDPAWFCIHVDTGEYKRWTDDEGNVQWRAAKTQIPITYNIYVGEVYSMAEVKALKDPDNKVLLSNMRINNWEFVVKTRANTWQVLNSTRDVVVPHV